MADDKNAREEQARAADRRQRERALREALERGDEPEPPVDAEVEQELASALVELTFPVTGADVVDAIGDLELDRVDGSPRVGTLIPDTTAETFDSPAAVLSRVRTPTVAEAMKRIVDAMETLPRAKHRGSPLDVYEKTLRALRAIEADDADEGVRVIADWIVERVLEDGRPPGSRAVRSEAADFCRRQGYAVPNDEWLGI